MVHSQIPYPSSSLDKKGLDNSNPKDLDGRSQALRIGLQITK